MQVNLLMFTGKDCIGMHHRAHMQILANHGLYIAGKFVCEIFSIIQFFKSTCLLAFFRKNYHSYYFTNINTNFGEKKMTKCMCILKHLYTIKAYQKNSQLCTGH
jgi:hypothetical protein